MPVDQKFLSSKVIKVAVPCIFIAQTPLIWATEDQINKMDEFELQELEDHYEALDNRFTYLRAFAIKTE